MNSTFYYIILFVSNSKSSFHLYIYPSISIYLSIQIICSKFPTICVNFGRWYCSRHLYWGILSAYDNIIYIISYIMYIFWIKLSRGQTVMAGRQRAQPIHQVPLPTNTSTPTPYSSLVMHGNSIMTSFCTIYWSHVWRSSIITVVCS